MSQETNTLFGECKLVVGWLTTWRGVLVNKWVSWQEGWAVELLRMWHSVRVKKKIVVYWVAVNDGMSTYVYEWPSERMNEWVNDC
jgi:hypothetical protein